MKYCCLFLFIKIDSKTILGLSVWSMLLSEYSNLYLSLKNTIHLLHTTLYCSLSQIQAIISLHTLQSIIRPSFWWVQTTIPILFMEFCVHWERLEQQHWNWWTLFILLQWTALSRVFQECQNLHKSLSKQILEQKRKQHFYRRKIMYAFSEWTMNRHESVEIPKKKALLYLLQLWLCHVLSIQEKSSCLFWLFALWNVCISSRQ